MKEEDAFDLQGYEDPRAVRGVGVDGMGEKRHGAPRLWVSEGGRRPHATHNVMEEPERLEGWVRWGELEARGLIVRCRRRTGTTRCRPRWLGGEGCVNVEDPGTSTFIRFSISGVGASGIRLLFPPIGNLGA